MLDDFFGQLWADYTRMTPRVSSIRRRLEARGETAVNDHVAFRTLDLEPIDIANLEPIIKDLGYTRFDDYAFEAKCLNARSYIKLGCPRIFLSELRCNAFPGLKPVFESLVRGVAAPRGPEVFTTGILWPAIEHDLYLRMREATEYGAWVAALGIRPNHFTVSVNALKGFETLESLCDFVEAEGFALNTWGGRIKGSPAAGLEQASTMADHVDVEFADGRYRIPTCYYEFALRHEIDGELFDGFITSSADKIFESTRSSIP